MRHYVLLADGSEPPLFTCDLRDMGGCKVFRIRMTGLHCSVMDSACSFETPYHTSPHPRIECRPEAYSLARGVDARRTTPSHDAGLRPILARGVDARRATPSHECRPEAFSLARGVDSTRVTLARMQA